MKIVLYFYKQETKKTGTNQNCSNLFHDFSSSQSLNCSIFTFMHAYSLFPIQHSQTLCGQIKEITKIWPVILALWNACNKVSQNPWLHWLELKVAIVVPRWLAGSLPCRFLIRGEGVSFFQTFFLNSCSKSILILFLILSNSCLLLVSWLNLKLKFCLIGYLHLSDQSTLSAWTN